MDATNPETKEPPIPPLEKPSTAAIEKPTQIAEQTAKSFEFKPETQPFAEAEKESEEVTEELATLAKALPSPVTVKISKSKTLASIEHLLEEDLKEVYIAMPSTQKALFRRVGEQTAVQIESLMKQAQLQIVKILELIKRWLQIIPGVNKFFLEQEAKIKTDEIMKLREDLKKRGEI